MKRRREIYAYYKDDEKERTGSPGDLDMYTDELKEKSRGQEVDRSLERREVRAGK